MPLPKIIQQQVEKKLRKFCESSVPSSIRDKVRVGLRFRGNSVTLYEGPPSFVDSSVWIDIVVAQFRFDQASRRWILYCADRNSRWHEHLDSEPTHNFELLLREVDEDPTGIFSG